MKNTELLAGCSIQGVMTIRILVKPTNKEHCLTGKLAVNYLLRYKQFGME